MHLFICCYSCIFVLLQTYCITQSSVVAQNGGYIFVVSVCCHHCCFPVSLLSRSQEIAHHTAYKKSAWPHCISYSGHFTSFHACSTAQWVRCGMAQNTVMWCTCHYNFFTCNNSYLLWALLVWIVDCFGVPYVNAYTRKFKNTRQQHVSCKIPSPDSELNHVLVMHRFCVLSCNLDMLF